MLLPLAMFLVVAVFLYRGLYLDPAELPSAMIGKPFPAFSLPRCRATRPDPGRPARQAGAGQRVGHLVHFLPVEHPVLNKLAEQGVVIYGINYKDDNAAALKWLAEFHNPTSWTSATTTAAWA
jgi:hypothetical protein